jgi:hypothetical protein
VNNYLEGGVTNMKQANVKDKLRRPMTVQNNEDEEDYAADKFEKTVEVKKAVLKN